MKFAFWWLRAGSTISQLPYPFTLCMGDGIGPVQSSCCNKAARTVNRVTRASPGMQSSLQVSCLPTDLRARCWAHPGAYASPRTALPRRLCLMGPHKQTQTLPPGTQTREFPSKSILLLPSQLPLCGFLLSNTRWDSQMTKYYKFSGCNWFCNAGASGCKYRQTDSSLHRQYDRLRTHAPLERQDSFQAGRCKE